MGARGRRSRKSRVALPGVGVADACGAGLGAGGEGSDAAEGSGISKAAARAARRLAPALPEVLEAVESLYQDELKPFGRILRKRIAERAPADPGALAGEVPDVDIAHLRAVCEASPLLCVETEEGGDWSATFVGRPPSFIDVYDLEDVYPPSLWEEAAAYFEGLETEEMLLPGGRYSCAQALMSRGLPFLETFTLGQVCRFVQLAISKKKVLGYLNGAVVPYGRSQSMVKERCAVWQQPCTDTNAEASGLPLATWDIAKACLREILEGPGSVPLSNVKRLFRSRFRVELSETMLGHSKLSDLLQDARFADVCAWPSGGTGLSPSSGISPGSALSPFTLSKEGRVGRHVLNTFIHAPVTPSTPLPGAKVRSKSLPKDFCSERCDWEAACNALGFMPRPLCHKGSGSLESVSGSIAGATSTATPQSPDQSSPQMHSLLAGDARSPTLNDAPMKVPLRPPSSKDTSTPVHTQLLSAFNAVCGSEPGSEHSGLKPLALFDSPGFLSDRELSGETSFASDGGEPQRRVLFCPDEPLCLEDAGQSEEALHSGRSPAVPAPAQGLREAPSPPAPKPPPGLPTLLAPRRDVLSPVCKEGPSPSPSKRAARSLAKAVGSMCRSRSLPKDVGSSKLLGLEVPDLGDAAPGAQRAALPARFLRTRLAAGRPSLLSPAATSPGSSPPGGFGLWPSRWMWPTSSTNAAQRVLHLANHV